MAKPSMTLRIEKSSYISSSETVVTNVALCDCLVTSPYAFQALQGLTHRSLACAHGVGNVELRRRAHRAQTLADDAGRRFVDLIGRGPDTAA